jgi:hypothetical protein
MKTFHMNKQPRRLVLGGLTVLLGLLAWLPCVHWVFRPGRDEVRNDTGIPLRAKELAARQLRLWNDPKARASELARMRRTNPEWDFMGRTFLVLALAEMSLREPALQATNLTVMDQVIEDTLRLEREGTMHAFLMPYSRERPFVRQPARSLFVDSEIALMLGARRLLAEQAEYKPLMAGRITVMAERLQQSPALAVESYPDECWLFDHAMALAAFRLADVLDGTDHRPLTQAWLTTAKRTLIHPPTGLLVSNYTAEGQPMVGPEGSSIWVAIHCLRLVDEEFARDQYRRARRELGRELLGFGWSREWPLSRRDHPNVDSGMVIPVLDASAGGSGLAFVAASSFRDDDFLLKLHTSLEFAAFPQRRAGEVRYCASNQVGDAALLYSLVLGPMWERLKEGRR